MTLTRIVTAEVTVIEDIDEYREMSNEIKRVIEERVRNKSGADDCKIVKVQDFIGE